MFKLLLRPVIQPWLGMAFVTEWLFPLPHNPPTHSLTAVILFYNYEWCEWPLSWNCHYLHPSQREFQLHDVEQDSEETAQASVLASLPECCLG